MLLILLNFCYYLSSFYFWCNTFNWKGKIMCNSNSIIKNGSGQPNSNFDWGCIYSLISIILRKGTDPLLTMLSSIFIYLERRYLITGMMADGEECVSVRKQLIHTYHTIHMISLMPFPFRREVIMALYSFLFFNICNLQWLLGKEQLLWKYL